MPNGYFSVLHQTMMIVLSSKLEYNTLMVVRMSFAALTAAATLLTPISAQAYATPEEVLFEESFFLPPSGRDAKNRVAAQRQQSTERREKDQAEYFASQREPEEPTIEDILAKLTKAIEGLEKNTPEARRTDRLVARVERRTDGTTGQTIRSGAPLAPTGAGAIIAIVSILAAVGWTLSKAKRVSSG